ncbi:hypothetical protein H0N96_01630, partial [Candidatus Micrarchaeota archaeon]|nr:hypothetical protein [Candidatus Micrarchaeota archaeon]
MKNAFALSILILISASAFVAADLPPLLPTGAYAVGLYARDAATGKAFADHIVSYHFEQQTARKGLSIL